MSDASMQWDSRARGKHPGLFALGVKRRPITAADSRTLHSWDLEIWGNRFSNHEAISALLPIEQKGPRGD
jgi:hypothetical protein